MRISSGGPDISAAAAIVSTVVWLCEMAAGRATNRHITPGPAARFLREDMAIRKALDTILRLWKPPHSYESAGAAKAAKGARLEREHVVPVRAMIDRMINDPSECRALLEKVVVIAHVTRAEHKQLVFTYKDPVYGRQATVETLDRVAA